MFDKVRRAADRLTASDPSPGGAENVVWVFGTIRTGSTWLGQMMGDMPGTSMWNEPRVGELFGNFYYEKAAHRRGNNNFILSDNFRRPWLRAVRSLILDAAGERYPGLLGRGILVIKEPSGSIGAPLLAEALPESRMVLLVRDPRDMVASALDAAREGSWAYELKGSRQRRAALGREGRAKEDDRIVRQRARLYTKAVGNSKEAFDAHEGPKSLVRYEDLRSDTLATMRRMYSELGVAFDDGALREVVRKHGWENIPREEKGEGKFTRKASPGSWREDLTPEQIETVEDVTASLLEEFYPGSRTTSSPREDVAT